MTDLELCRGRLPSYRPALCRLEERITPSTFTNYQFTDYDGNIQTATFDWGTGGAYDTALANSGYAAASASAISGDANMLDGSYSGTTANWSGAALATLTNATIGPVGDYENGVRSLAGPNYGSSLAYGPVNTSNVTIAASVTSVATARARCQVLVADAKAKLQRNIDLVNYCNSISNKTDKAVVSLWYGPEEQQNWVDVQKDIKELNLIKASGWNTGANANAIFR